MSAFWPITSEYVTGRIDEMLHAVEQSTTRRRDRRVRRRIAIIRTPPKQWTVACGVRVEEIVGACAVGPDGPTDDLVVLAWPPPAKSGEGQRCRDCWQATGKKRQAEQWRNLEPVATGDARSVQT